VRHSNQLRSLSKRVHRNQSVNHFGKGPLLRAVINILANSNQTSRGDTSPRIAFTFKQHEQRNKKARQENQTSHVSNSCKLLYDTKLAINLCSGMSLGFSKLSQSESLQNLLDHLQEFWRSKNMNLMLRKVGRYIASAFRSYELYQSKVT